MISQIIRTSRILFLSCLFTSSIYSQPIVKLWDKTIGGSKNDMYGTNIIVNKNQILFACESSSDSGFDKSQNSYQPIPTPLNNNYGTWLISLDRFGNKLWDKVIGGRVQTLPLNLAIKDSNSFYLSCTIQNQDTTFDLTAPVNHPLNNNFATYWVSQLNFAGSIISNHRYTPLNTFINYSDMLYLKDRIYLSGSSGPNNVNTGGDFNLIQNCSPQSRDFFLSKINLDSNKVDSSLLIGGSNQEIVYRINEGWNNSIIVCGITSSNVSCNQNVGAWVPSSGVTPQPDIFIINIDSLNIIKWQKHYGGYSLETISDILKTNDLGYLVYGSSKSPQGLDLSQSLLYGNSSSIWVLKLDSNGNKIWDKRFSDCSSSFEFGVGSNSNSSNGKVCKAHCCTKTSDGGFVFIHNIQNNTPCGDVSEFPRSNIDIWILKIDSLGYKVWDKRFGSTTSAFNSAISIAEIDTGIYVLSAFTDGGVGGDKSDPSRGQYDMWLICFADTTIATLTGYEEINKKDVQFNIWPNPTNQTLYYSIANTVKVEQIEVINLLGEVVLRAENLLDNTINVASLQAGTYIISAKLNNNAIVRKRFVVVR